ncbi:hypothetical protein [Roseospirillum parvum]|uniref:Uncharacterized protein n=1 Tax=Roseospirillum parvum TaxID=83401 RepID=A0A1G8EUM2_9PROT|nr:hypothetical protein [Roseospirillum parvum]SDH73606.1 hypothetical protein SAMN05421742_11145 [Roseospirillum parvum]
MPTPTSYHAFNLFTLTMESRHGGNWRRDLSADDIARLAEEVASGFGGEVIDPGQGSEAVPTMWRFPDDSEVRTGRFGLKVEESAAAHSAA